MTTPQLPEPRCCSDYKIDRYLSGDMDADERAACDVHWQQSPRCLRRVDEVRSAHAQPLPPRVAPSSTNAHDPRPQPLSPGERGASTTRRVRWLASGGAILAAAAALVVVVQRAPDETTTKGRGPAVVVYVNDGDSVREVGDGDAVAAGDALRFAVRASSPGFAAVIGTDARGARMPYAPSTLPSARAVAVAAGTLVALPGAVALDDVVGPERVTAWHCDTPVVLEALLDGDEAGCTSTAVVLHKRPRGPR